MSGRPSPFELWQQAGGDAEEYRRLLREHGHLVPGKPEPLPCGRAPVTAAARSGPAEIRITAPPGTDPETVRDLAEHLAAGADRGFIWAGRPQCCPMDTYGTDSAGDLRPVCTCDDGCPCFCLGCRCPSRWDGDDG